MGGEAVANADNVADWEGGQRLINAAVEAFGDLHVLVNNAGILRDRVLVNMTEEEWDAVIHVHLKGHFVPDPLGRRLLAGADQGGQGRSRRRSSTRRRPRACSATPARPTTARPRPASPPSRMICRHGARAATACASNAIAPAARTRLTEATPGLGDVVKAPDDAGKFDVWDPANISPLVAYLATEDCPLTGKTFFVQGGKVQLFQPLDHDRDHREGRPLDGRRARVRDEALRVLVHLGGDPAGSHLAECVLGTDDQVIGTCARMTSPARRRPVPVRRRATAAPSSRSRSRTARWRTRTGRPPHGRGSRCTRPGVAGA